MKKVLSIAILFALLVVMCVGGVYAATTTESVNSIYAIGSKYGMTSAEKVKLERFISDNKITDEEAEKLVAKAQEAEKVMTDAGVKNYKELTTAQKSQLKTIANEAASTVGVSLEFKTGSVSFYKDGKLLETITKTDGKLAYTGNDVNYVLVVSSIAAIALAAGLISKKVRA